MTDAENEPSYRSLRTTARICRSRFDCSAHASNVYYVSGGEVTKVAETFGGAAMGIVLTGMGQDGLRGVQALKAKGAFVVAQDQASSVIWGSLGHCRREGQTILFAEPFTARKD